MVVGLDENFRNIEYGILTISLTLTARSLLVPAREYFSYHVAAVVMVAFPYSWSFDVERTNYR